MLQKALFPTAPKSCAPWYPRPNWRLCIASSTTSSSKSGAGSALQMWLWVAKHKYLSIHGLAWGQTLEDKAFASDPAKVILHALKENQVRTSSVYWLVLLARWGTDCSPTASTIPAMRKAQDTKVVYEKRKVLWTNSAATAHILLWLWKSFHRAGRNTWNLQYGWRDWFSTN